MNRDGHPSASQLFPFHGTHEKCLQGSWITLEFQRLNAFPKYQYIHCYNTCSTPVANIGQVTYGMTSSDNLQALPVH